ncbi:hypothetical protein Hanom_Chr00s004394g01721761 [Helianthus anomalus]
MFVLQKIGILHKGQALNHKIHKMRLSPLVIMHYKDVMIPIQSFVQLLGCS